MCQSLRQLKMFACVGEEISSPRCHVSRSPNGVSTLSSDVQVTGEMS